MTLWLLGTCLAVVGIVALALLFAGLGQRTGVARSLEIIERGPARPASRNHLDLPARDRLVAPFIDAARGLGARLSPSGTNERLLRSLGRAGNPAAWTLDRVMGTKGLGLVAGGLLGLFLGGLSLRGVLFLVLGAGAGFFLPDLLVYNAATKRQDALRNGLPDALDMLTICIEAGQGFDGALQQVARAIQGPIAGEFARALAEIQIGRTRGEAFASMGNRATAPEVKSFVGALVQADRLGLPIAGVLREQSTNLRVVRRQRAEEQAQKVTVKILFPLLLCIFPALFVVIVGPGVIRMIDVFGGFGR